MHLREARRRRRWTQAELARRAGVSRQLVGAVEAGNQEPGVVAAIGLARALGQPVEELFGTRPGAEALSSVLGGPILDGPVRVATVGDATIVEPVDRLDALDGAEVHGRIIDGELHRDADGPPPVVVAGCEPAMGMLARWDPHRHPMLWVNASSRAAEEAFRAGRVHLATVHGPVGETAVAPPDCSVYGVARWRVGIAFRPDARGGAAEWIDRAERFVHREDGAAVQTTARQWAAGHDRALPSGPVASGHTEVCRWVRSGVAPAGITTEPAAIAAGLGFEPIEEHSVYVWCSADSLAERSVAAVLDRLGSSAFAKQLAALPAYDVGAAR